LGGFLSAVVPGKVNVTEFFGRDQKNKKNPATGKNFE